MEPKNRLKGKVAFVTAAAGAGIGQATARLLAHAGADVVVTDIAGDRCERVAAEIAQETGRTVLGREMDILDEGTIAAVIGEATDELGHVDVLVNNAGTSEPRPVWETSTESWKRVVDVNLTGTFLTMRAVLPQMIERRYGSIVNIASTEAWTSRTPGNTAYHAAKAGVLALTRSSAEQVAEFGVRVNAVAPGLVPNPFLSRMLDPDHLAQMESEIPLGRSVEPSEIADAVLFLASEASSAITGEAINVSGGMFMRP